MESYNYQKIEKKWQKEWEKSGIYKAKDFSKKKKYYCLIEFPYPSGEGLHVGHTRSYTAMDIIARKRRMEGYNVLNPIGWDAFGLPTENYAIKTGIHPKIVTRKNTDNFRKQLKSLGFSFDWSREINTTDPQYYKWTQWIFLQLYKKGLAYKKKLPINWCLSCKVGLANEEVIDGKCERCGGPTEKREKDQWILAITKYADRLADDLDKVDYLEKIKIQQKNWIGKSEGVLIKFKILNSKNFLEVFTTRIDTIFGCTYVVVAPEHEIISNLKSQISNLDEVEKYLDQTKKKSDLQRTELEKEKTGVELRGLKAINPANGQEVPIFVADYVLGHYGTGAIMAVPAHDERDAQFARKFNLPVSNAALAEPEKAIIAAGAKKIIQYHLRDWIFSRQHYWGEPIPMAYCEKCGWIPVLEKDLPVKLPDVKRYEPTDTGESPLANIKNWVETKCPKCKGPAKRETDTMPNWAGSSWYYLAYLMRRISNFQFPISKYKKAFKYWMPIDWYNGGMEHTTLHLLYSRFWNKFLFDIGAVPESEPYKKRTSHGMILGEDGEKMSKSRGNVVNPDLMVSNFGADAYRLYQMFMGPFDQAIPWDSHGIEGTSRFLKRIWKLKSTVSSQSSAADKNLEKLLHKTIKKVSEDIEEMKFNTAVSALMILANEMEHQKQLQVTDYELLITLLAPFAPHICEEIWHNLGHKDSVHTQKWSKYDPRKIEEKNFNLVVQINGKVRDSFEAPFGIPQEEAEALTLKRENVKKWIYGKTAKKVVFVPDKLINIVV